MDSPSGSPTTSSKRKTVTTLLSHKKKRPTQTTISRNTLFLWLISAIVVLTFVIIVYIAHLQIQNEIDSPNQFIYSRLQKFQTINPSSIEVPLSDNQLIVNIPVPKKKDPNLRTSPPLSTSDKDLLTEERPSSQPDTSIHDHPLNPPPIHTDSLQNPDIDTSIELRPEDFKNHELTCPHGDLVTFWKKPTASDLRYRTPYLKHPPRIKYVTFEPDVGGWNNIRMQMELCLVFAYATGRTFVMPPDQPMYLLNQGKGHQKAHSFMDFFPFDFIKKRMEVITMEEFMTREGITGHLRDHKTKHIKYPPGNKTVFVATERDERLSMWEYLRSVAGCPKWQSMNEFLVIPAQPGQDHADLSNPVTAKRQFIFAANRTAVHYDRHWQKQQVIHFISKPGAGYRLLDHFYTYIFFENEYMDRYFKRFVRDYVHYMDEIFCKASIIINQLMEESHGQYNSFHIRRGEFQYKVVKIPSAQILKNIKKFIPKNQLVYVATDERNKTFFQAFKDYFPTVKYLDDYMDIADLRNVNPNYLGMIDQVICSRSQFFVGTWFSTFSGYITRMRGYFGYPDQSVWYGDREHRDRFQKPEIPKFPFYMREWNNSWYEIDDE